MNKARRVRHGGPHLYSQHWGGRGRLMSVSLRSVWSTQCITGAMVKDPMSNKTKQTNELKEQTCTFIFYEL